MSKDESGGYSHARIAQFYEHVPSYRSRGDVEFYIEEAVASGGPVLELGCGTGRIALPVAREGIAVTGLDLAASMLEIFREKLAREDAAVQQRVTLVHGDMCAFDLGSEFPLITIPFRAFGHIVSPEGELACVRCANRHLPIGGRLIVDLFQTNTKRMHDPAFLEETEDFRDAALPDGALLRRTHRATAFHRSEQYNDIEFRYYVTHADGRTEELVQAFPFRYFFRYEVEHLLGRCGFRVVEILGNFDRSTFGDDSPEMIFVAEKAADLAGSWEVQ